MTFESTTIVDGAGAPQQYRFITIGGVRHAVHVVVDASGNPIPPGGWTPARGVLANGTPVVVVLDGMPFPRTIYTVPASGCTVAVAYSLDGTNYHAWADGPVTAEWSEVFWTQVQSVSFTRTVGSATTSTYGVI